MVRGEKLTLLYDFTYTTCSDTEYCSSKREVHHCLFIYTILSAWQHGSVIYASYQCPTLCQNLRFNKLINNPPCVHRYKEGWGMSLHGHRYCGRLRWQRANGFCPLAILAKQFPGRHFCERGHSWAFDCHSGGRSKAQLTASIYISSLVCLLWTAPVPSPTHIPHWAASCSIILSPRVFPALSRGHFIDATMAVWQYILVIYKRPICTFDLSTRGKYNNLLEADTLILQQNYQM